MDDYRDPKYDLPVIRPQDPSTIVEPPELTFADIKLCLQGLIKRNPEEHNRPETEEERLAREARRDARQRRVDNNELRMLSLSEPGSIKFVEVDRAGALRLIEDGWVFDEATTAWAMEKP